MGRAKTTAIEGLRRANARFVRVLDLDPRSGRLALAEQIAVQQDSGFRPLTYVAKLLQGL